MNFDEPAYREPVCVEMMPAERTPAPPLDLTHLRRFTMGNTALEREVLQLFATQTPAILCRLELADTPRAWGEAAHSLKGSARAVGALAIARLAEQAERIETGLGQPRAAVVLALKAAIADAVRYIHDLDAAA